MQNKAELSQLGHGLGLELGLNFSFEDFPGGISGAEEAI